MVEAKDTYGSISQNLMDAGCSGQMAEHCKALLQERDMPELFKQLSKHRQHLLDQVHIHQKEIDCLDYLI